MSEKVRSARQTSKAPEREQADEETRIVRVALATLARKDPDLANLSAIKIVEAHRLGTAMQNVAGYALAVYRSVEIDQARRDKRERVGLRELGGEPQATVENAVDTIPSDVLAEWKRRARITAQEEAAELGWPARWRLLIGTEQTKCPRCEGRCVIAERPDHEWTRIEVPELGTMIVPPTCTACEGSGRARDVATLSTEDEERRKRLRAKAKDAATRLKKAAKLERTLSGPASIAHLHATLEALEHEPDSLRVRLVKGMCSLWVEADVAVTARDLGLAALLAGDFPGVATLAPPAKIIKAMTATMRAVHGRMLKTGIVRALTQRK